MSTTQHTPSAGALRAAELIHPYTIQSMGSAWTVEEMAETIDRETAARDLLEALLAIQELQRAQERNGSSLLPGHQCVLMDAAIAKAKGES